MGLRVNTNIDALQIHQNLASTSQRMSDALSRLSSGQRIQSAKDEASGMAVANKFKAEASAMRVAYQNATEASSTLQVADGGYSKVQDVLIRMKDLATQSASSQLNEKDRTTLNKEYLDLKSEVDRIAEGTKYGNQSLIAGAQAAATQASGSGTTGTQTTGAQTTGTQVAAAGTGAGSGASTATVASNVTSLTYQLYAGNAANGTPSNTITIDLQSAKAADLGKSGDNVVTADGVMKASEAGASQTTAQRLSVADTGIGSADDAKKAMAVLDNAIGQINGYMSNVGANQNRLQYSMDNLQTSIQNYSASESAIRDVDMADEVTTFTKNQILQQTGVAMLSQANQAPQQILQLLR